MVAMEKVNHDKRLYSFSHFVPKSPSQALLAQSNSQMQLWHERFGHLAFCSFQQLCSNKMVKGLTSINFSTSECSIGSMDMHLEEKSTKGKSSRASVVLQSVHMVLASPFALTSISQGHYILSLMTFQGTLGFTFFITRMKCWTSF